MLNAPKTKEGCARQMALVLKLYRQDFAGGGSFGYDWPTFRLNAPALYARVRALQALYPHLPSRRAA